MRREGRLGRVNIHKEEKKEKKETTKAVFVEKNATTKPDYLYVHNNNDNSIQWSHRWPSLN